MAQPYSIYVTWQYHMLTEPEMAQTGLHIVSERGIDAETEALFLQITPGQLQALDTAWAKLMDVAAISTANYAQYVGLKAALLDNNGEYRADPMLHVRTTPKVGGSGAILPQASICFSTLAYSQLGKGKRGRFYMPYTGPNSWNTGSPRMPAGLVPAMAAGGAALIHDVNAALGDTIGGKGVVAIIHKAPGSGTGTAEWVRSIKVGDIVDTQRRRRNQISENYFAAGVTF